MGVSPSTVKNFEAGKNVLMLVVTALERALAGAGVELIQPNNGSERLQVAQCEALMALVLQPSLVGCRHDFFERKSASRAHLDEFARARELELLTN